MRLGHAVREMYDEAAGGVDCGEIAGWLNDCGYRTIRGNEFTSRAVRSLLLNPVYKGEVHFQKAGVRIEHHHEPLVDHQTWNQVQERLAVIYRPRVYLGYEPYSFLPNSDRKYVEEMFLEAAGGVEPKEIAGWMNDCHLKTTRGNEHTSRSVRSILANPIYCGDIFLSGNRIINHHAPLVDREVWNVVNIPAA